ncbi:hypothetical protein ABIQ69_14890 [Agromyces sp. G08B096]|uniref:Uncharacterized protein n=1 Tax=Agromyces sp. G08B096 TaxID=3156399 RepID=A0AAU7W6C8_9MICO
MTEEPMRRPRVRASDVAPRGRAEALRAAASAVVLRGLRGVLESRPVVVLTRIVRTHRLGAFITGTALAMLIAFGATIALLQSLPSGAPVAEPRDRPRTPAAITSPPASYAPILPSPAPGTEAPPVDTEPVPEPEVPVAEPEPEPTAEPDPQPEPEPDVPPGHTKRPDKPGR